MIEPLRLAVLTPAETVLEVAGVARVQVQLADGGGISIYPGHAPLLAETVTAPVTYGDAAGEHALELEAGILQIDQQGVTIFTAPRTALPTAIESQAPERFRRLAGELLSDQRARAAGSSDEQKG
ncbi:MAG: hypothetical protein JW900_11165 [Anaerolineae bacterium]|nr:hypothetical protein [Anaerolineae bacterium]